MYTLIIYEFPVVDHYVCNLKTKKDEDYALFHNCSQPTISYKTSLLFT